MTTTPTTTPSNPTVIPSWITSWEAFIKAHERIILIGISSLLLWHFGDKAFDTWKSTRDTAAQTQINQQINSLHAENQATLAQLTKSEAQLNATIAQLQAKIAAGKQAEQKQEQNDATLPMPELAAHWQTMLVLPEGSITPQTNGTISVSTDAAHTTVEELEKVPQLTEEVIDQANEIKACTDTSAEKDKAIAGVQAELAEQVKGRAADAKVAADKQKHSFWKGFKWGYVAGITTAVLVKVATVVK